MSNEEEFDQWELATGLGLDDVDVDVTDAEFVINNQLGPNLSLKLTMVPRNGEETKEQFYTMGKGWVAVDGGRAATSEDGQPKKISQSSNLGLFLKAIEVSVGKDAARALGNPLKAATYVDSAWHVGRTTRKVLNPETGIEKDTSIVLPTAGIASEKAAAKPAAAAPKSKAPKSDDDGVTKAITELTLLAASFEDEDDFVEKAATLDIVKSNRAVQKLLYADGFHASLLAA